MFATYLVLEERVPDIFCHSGHGQNVILAFLISMGTDSIAEGGALIPNHPESTMRELAQLLVELTATTHSNRLAHRSSSPPPCSVSSLSSEHSLSSRAMMESSLSFTDGDRCSIFNRQPGEIYTCGIAYLVEFQKRAKRRLDKRAGSSLQQVEMSRKTLTVRLVIWS